VSLKKVVMILVKLLLFNNLITKKMINLPKICQEANQSKNKQKMQEAINKVDM
jgi:hypothetical protein